MSYTTYLYNTVSPEYHILVSVRRHRFQRTSDFLENVQDKTKNNSRVVLTLALSYGSREEIISAIKEISDKVKNNIISSEKIDESVINEHLYTLNLPDIDLMIRTSGEHRISNFLLWQIAYAEFYFTDVLWPDFDETQLHKAFEWYSQRERRFGRTSAQLASKVMSEAV